MTSTPLLHRHREEGSRPGNICPGAVREEQARQLSGGAGGRSHTDAHCAALISGDTQTKPTLDCRTPNERGTEEFRRETNQRWCVRRFQTCILMESAEDLILTCRARYRNPLTAQQPRYWSDQCIKNNQIGSSCLCNLTISATTPCEIVRN